jgi:hypothetical protein
VVAAWTSSRRTLKVAVLNSTDVDQSIKLNIKGANFAGTGMLRRLASTDSTGQKPTISDSLVNSIPDSL